jgi:hypothetical protein
MDAAGLAVEVSAEGESSAAVPDFAVLDANPNSTSFGERVSPRDFEGAITAWYFTHTT